MQRRPGPGVAAGSTYGGNWGSASCAGGVPATDGPVSAGNGLPQCWQKRSSDSVAVPQAGQNICVPLSLGRVGAEKTCLAHY